MNRTEQMIHQRRSILSLPLLKSGWELTLVGIQQEIGISRHLLPGILAELVRSGKLAKGKPIKISKWIYHQTWRLV